MPLNVLHFLPLVFSAIARSSVCPTTVSSKIRISGNSYSSRSASSADECCAFCDADRPSCIAWVFYVNQSSCRLKNESKHEASDDRCISGKYDSPTPTPPTPPSPTPDPSLDFAPIFHGGAVLQRSRAVPVWGIGAKKGFAVTLSLDGVEIVSVQADAGGNWSAELPPQKAGFNRTLKVADKQSGSSNSVVVSFGEVVLCSGQSNMGMPVVNKPGGFQADNGTAEAAAAGRYTGKIWLKKGNRATGEKSWWMEASPTTLLHPGFSAVCWYSGRDLFNAMGGHVPVGLIESAVGGSPIEYWISPEAISACEVDKPQCDNNKEDSVFYHEMIEPHFPYALGAVIWDQAERDVKCPVSLAAYPCLQRQLVSTWRASFASSFAFVAVQLHGYTATLKNGTGSYDGGVTAEMVYTMRMAQDAGVRDVDQAGIIATYDLSCPNSPFSSVHIPDKADVGARVARQLRHLLLDDELVVEGPRAMEATSIPNAHGFEVQVHFSGGSSPFELRGTRNCTSCCQGVHSMDFDVSADGVSWVNGTTASVKAAASGATVYFNASLPAGASPKYVRHTAASIWPQCALYNSEGLPAMPFYLTLPDSPVKATFV